MTGLIPETIETDRLRLELIRPTTVDVLELYAICSADPAIDRITEYLPWEPHETPKETLEFVERVADQYESASGAAYVIRPREGEAGSGEIAGVTGVELDWEKRTLVPGIWLRRRFWGRRYAGERAAAVLALAFERLDLELVAITAHVENDRSNRAIRRYVEAHGGDCDGQLRNWRVYAGEPVDCYRYSISRTEWKDAQTDVTVRFE